MKHARALVMPEILTWARTTAGLTIEEASKALQTKHDNVLAWEKGEKQPSMPQLRKMATTYKRLLSDFYLPKAPETVPFPHDFRRLPGEVAQVYSRELRFELRAAAERRKVAIDLLEELDTRPQRFKFKIAVGLHHRREDRHADAQRLDLGAQHIRKTAHRVLRSAVG